MTKKQIQEKYQNSASRYTVMAKILENWLFVVFLLSLFTFIIADTFLLKLFIISLFTGYAVLSWATTRMDIRERIKLRNIF
ncbi:hypothetical protein M2139_001742 [Enterococcus sp. PF1-24]|uniref:hypothetical protein n=1 Tax=unclassified Enterococcus TaxID=2608891 RepID=UPI002473F8A4|nr:MULTISPECIES: hypothetical protein [unclassified Enterococcus]MDH6364682.1 hypothetical protein [Enterococcus sp. PFB1-1]MDH6401842.1 hypothetical protein [Enterococcus sp. PF1-24]